MKSKREHTSLDKRMVFVQEIEESQFFVKIKRERPKEWNLGPKNTEKFLLSYKSKASSHGKYKGNDVGILMRFANITRNPPSEVPLLIYSSHSWSVIRSNPKG